MNPSLHIYVSPSLLDGRAGPIYWIWRTVLGWMGMPWTEVGRDTGTCDVAYVVAGDSAPLAGLTIRADAAAWSSVLGASGSIGDGPVTRLQQYGEPAAWQAAVVVSGGGSLCGYDPMPDCFAMLAGVTERTWPRNRHGQVLPAGATLAHEALRLTPIVNAAIDQLAAVLRRHAAAPPAVERWPAGREWAACATHDVDYPETVRWLEPLRVIARLGTTGLRPAFDVATGRRHHWHFASWVALERSLNVRSAFYFVARRGSLAEYALGTPDPFYDVSSAKFHALFRRLDADGFEVGLQASYRACESPARLALEKHTLDQCLGRPVEGNRHHYWRLDPGDPDATLAAHAAAGLAYDCSIGFETFPGWRRGSALPFDPYDRASGTGIATLQLPTAWMDAQLFVNFPGGPDADERRRALLTQLVRATAAVGGVFVADMHEYVFDERLFPGWQATWAWLWSEIQASGDVWVAPPREVAAHWRARENRIIAASRGLVH